MLVTEEVIVHRYMIYLCRSQDETMSQNEVYGRYTKPVFGPDVVYAADPKKRNQQMQHMAYGLRTARLKSYVPMIEKETRTFLKSWGASVS